ncbi:MAG: hypothetical protein AAFV95_22585 [Bacteroidota bacterium]
MKTKQLLFILSILLVASCKKETQNVNYSQEISVTVEPGFLGDDVDCLLFFSEPSSSEVLWFTSVKNGDSFQIALDKKRDSMYYNFSVLQMLDNNQGKIAFFEIDTYTHMKQDKIVLGAFDRSAWNSSSLTAESEYQEIEYDFATKEDGLSYSLNGFQYSGYGETREMVHSVLPFRDPFNLFFAAIPEGKQEWHYGYVTDLRVGEGIKIEENMLTGRLADRRGVAVPAPFDSIKYGISGVRHLGNNEYHLYPELLGTGLSGRGGIASQIPIFEPSDVFQSFFSNMVLDDGQKSHLISQHQETVLDAYQPQLTDISYEHDGRELQINSSEAGLAMSVARLRSATNPDIALKPIRWYIYSPPNVKVLIPDIPIFQEEIFENGTENYSLYQCDIRKDTRYRNYEEFLRKELQTPDHFTNYYGTYFQREDLRLFAD